MDENMTEEQRKQIARRRAQRRKRWAKQRRKERILRGVVIGTPLLLLVAVVCVVVSVFNGSKKNTSETIDPQTEVVVNESEEFSETESEEETTAPTTAEVTTAEVTTEIVTTTAAATKSALEADIALTTDPAYKNPMSTYEIHQGQWDLSTLDTKVNYMGYSDKSRDANMIPKDWEYYEQLYGMFNVDWIQDTSKKIIYLTMDDGYANSTTEKILDTLKEKNVKVVFFITKKFLDSSKSTVQRMLDEGHQIGNHTCTHALMPNLSIEDQKSEIMTLQNQVKEEFGYTMKLFRYPQGGFNPQSLGLVDNLGLKTVFWTYGYNDYSTEQPPVQESYEAAVSHLHNGAIYLLHASSTTNEAFLADFIDAVRAKGYEFGIYPTTAN